MYDATVSDVSERRQSKGAKAREAKINPVATVYQLGCMRRHFDRLQRGKGMNRAQERAAIGRKSRSKPPMVMSYKMALSIARGRNVIDLFVRRGIRLNSRKVLLKPMVSGVRRVIRSLFSK